MITNEEYYRDHESKMDLMRDHAEPPAFFKCEWCEEKVSYDEESEKKGVCVTCWNDRDDKDAVDDSAQL